MKLIYYKEGKVLSINTNILFTDKKNDSKNAPTEVYFDNKKGYYKESTGTSPKMDRFEYVIGIIGDFLGIEMCPTYLVYTDEGKFKGIISENVLKEDETLCLTNKILSFLEENNIKITNEMIKALEEYQKIMFDKQVEVRNKLDRYGQFIISLIDNSKYIPLSLNIFEEILKGFINNKEDLDIILKSFYEMIILDILVGNQDRNIKNYGIAIDRKFNVRFYPLFDDSCINIPGIDSNLTQINGMFMNREELLNYLITEKRNYVEDIINKIISSKNELHDIIVENKDFMSDGYSWFSGRISSGFETIEKIANLSKKQSI